MAKIPANFNSMAFIKKMKAQKAAAEVNPVGPDLANYKKPAGPAVDSVRLNSGGGSGQERMNRLKRQVVGYCQKYENICFGAPGNAAIAKKNMEDAIQQFEEMTGKKWNAYATDKQWPACQEGRHQFNGKSFCGRCGEPAPKALDRRSRLHAALDAVMDAGGTFGGTEVFQLRDGWHLIFKGAVAKANWADKGGAEAQLALLKKGYSSLLPDGTIKHSAKSAEDENTIIYGKRPVVRKTLSILNPKDLEKMTGVPGGIGKGKPYTGFAKDGVDPARYAAEVAKRRTELNGKSTQELRQIAQQGSRLDYGGFKNVDKQSLVWHILSNSYGDKTLGEIYDYLNKTKAKDAETPQERARRKLSPDQAARLKALLAKVKTAPSAAAPMPRAKDGVASV